MTQSDTSIVAHTPGPWSVDTKYTRVTIVTEGGLGVAFMSQTTAIGNATFADARLIASAPDLLALIHKHLEDHLAACHLTRRGDVCPLVAETRSAIAQAEGQ